MKRGEDQIGEVTLWKKVRGLAGAVSCEMKEDVKDMVLKHAEEVY